MISLVVAAASIGVTNYADGISYFNSIAGGSVNGYQWLSHSNTHWGQDLYKINAWRDKHPGSILLTTDIARFSPQSIGVPIDAIEYLDLLGSSHYQNFGESPDKFDFHIISTQALRHHSHVYDHYSTEDAVDRIGYNLYVFSSNMPPREHREKDSLPKKIPAQ